MRVWLEGGADQFRARVMAADGDADDVGGDRTIALATSPEEVVVAVRRWLQDFIRRDIRNP